MNPMQPLRFLLFALVLSAQGVHAQDRAASLPDFTTLMKKQGPAVVNVTATRKTPGPSASAGNSGNSNRPRGGEKEDPMLEFFRRFLPDPDREARQGLASGFIISEDGYILTNAHVVDGFDDVSVRLSDAKREFKARVVGFDKRTDVALLKVEAKGLPVAKLGSSKGLQPGEWVAAIGSPFGFANTITAGIVSAKERSLPDEVYVPFIQTDVAVNPGNSGGPLFNLAGEVIGINSQIYSRTGGFQGLSFAIPINVALKVKDQIIATGKVAHARLGVGIQEINHALAESFGLKRAEGALVSSVAPGSAAERAGIQPGDVILKYDGKPVGAAGELSALVGQAIPGDKVRIELLRKGESLAVNATLGAAQAEQERGTRRRSSAEPAEGGRLGLSVRPLTPEERKQLNVAGGLLVEEVGGPAARAGVQAGDVVLMAGGKPVKSIEEFRAATSGGGNIALLVQRGDARVFLPLRVG